MTAVIFGGLDGDPDSKLQKLYDTQLHSTKEARNIDCLHTYVPLNNIRYVAIHIYIHKMKIFQISSHARMLQTYIIILIYYTDK